MPETWRRSHRFPMAPRRRPRWWPEGEPWPPERPPGAAMWRRYRGRMFWRAGCFFGLLFMFAAVGCVSTLWLAAAATTGLDLPRALQPAGPVAGVAALLLLGVLTLATIRAISRLTRPVDDFMDAVARVADGDYAFKVSERGPREMRRLARAFNAMTARLEAEAAQRRTLLADVTHELRTPLTVIQGNLEGMLDGVYPADAAHLAPILDETRVLSRLIDDLRTLAEAESGTLALHREPTDLSVLCGETMAAYRPQAQAAGVDLALEAGGDVPLANVDPVRIREVVSNLVANALRYTGEGGKVSVRVAVQANGGNEEPPPEEGLIVIEVADTGTGIGPEALPHIFERFYKGPDSRGSGLGLAIAKDLVEAHGGQIAAQSVAGQGTTMTVRLEAGG